MPFGDCCVRARDGKLKQPVVLQIRGNTKLGQIVFEALDLTCDKRVCLFVPTREVQLLDERSDRDHVPVEQLLEIVAHDFFSLVGWRSLSFANSSRPRSISAW